MVSYLQAVLKNSDSEQIRALLMMNSVFSGPTIVMRDEFKVEEGLMIVSYFATKLECGEETYLRLLRIKAGG